MSATQCHLSWRKPLCPTPSESAVDYIGRVHGGIETIEFPRTSRGLLVAAGTGLMLSLMDQVPKLRWCVDADGFGDRQRDALPAWLQCMQNVTSFIVVAGWYCSTNPEPLARAVRPLRDSRLRVYVQCRGVGGDAFAGHRTANTLDELIAQANELT
jgi:hypothetical protein